MNLIHSTSWLVTMMKQVMKFRQVIFYFNGYKKYFYHFLKNIFTVLHCHTPQSTRAFCPTTFDSHLACLLDQHHLHLHAPTTQDIYLDRRPKGNFLNKKVEIINDHVQLLSKSNGNDLIKEMKRLKREEMKECNSNLGRFYEGIENVDGVLLILFIFQSYCPI